MKFEVDKEIKKKLFHDMCCAKNYNLEFFLKTDLSKKISEMLTILFFQQKTVINMNGEDHVCCSGNIFLMKENCNYSIKLLSDETRIKGVYILNLYNTFFSELFYTQLSSCPIFYDFFKERTGSSEYLFFDNTQNTDACWCAMHLLWEATFTNPEDEENVQASLIVFLRDLHRTHQQHLIISESSMMKNYKFKAGSYLKYMADNYQTVTLESIAAEFNYSPAYFSTMFKKTVWINFSDKLLELKLEHAKRLLVTTKLSIEDIAVRAGFTEKSYFHRCFKKKFSMTPGQYRKLNNE